MTFLLFGHPGKTQKSACCSHARGKFCVYGEVLKMLIGLEDAHAFHVSAFGGVEHLRAIKTIP
jgi:hypothetical protein